MHKTTRSYYTIVELLVVVVIVGILLSVSMSGINRMLGRQGAIGAVRTLSSQLALARSYAVVKNAYVAILLPDAAMYTDKFDTTPALQSYLYTKTRVCLVKDFNITATPPITPIATFDSWIDGNEWQTLPSGTCASIDTTIGVGQVTDIAFDGNTGLKSSAIIFKPSGTLGGGYSSTISVFTGKYVPLRGLIYATKAGQRLGWDLTINPYTGRTSYEKQSN